MRTIYLMLLMSFLFHVARSQDKLLIRSKNYTISVLTTVNGDSLNVNFEFENKNQKSLLMFKNSPGIYIMSSVTGRLLDLNFGIDLVDMTERDFETKEIHPGEKKMASFNVPRKGNAEFILHLRNSFYWVKSGDGKKTEMYSSCYKKKEYEWSEMYIPIKI